MNGWIRTFALSVSVLAALAPALSLADDSRPAVEVRWGDGKVLISDEEIRAYDWATHTLTLAPNVREDLRRRLPYNRIVSGIPFSVTVGGNEMYAGTLTTIVSSNSFAKPVIAVDGHFFAKNRLQADQIRIQLGYPTAEAFEGEDPRNNAQLRQALTAAGKLSRVESASSRWLGRSLQEMQTIKVGMTREELLTVFREQTDSAPKRTQQTFAYRDSAYIQVDVTFEPVGAPDDSRWKSPNDRITRISKPYLVGPEPGS